MDYPIALRNLLFHILYFSLKQAEFSLVVKAFCIEFSFGRRF